VREAANRAKGQNNLRELAIAMHNYNDTFGSLPPAVIYDEDGKPLHSWRVLLLPYLEQNALFQQLRLSEPWDSPHNEPLLAWMPKVFAEPGGEGMAGILTRYQVFVGPGAPFECVTTPQLQPYRFAGAAGKLFVKSSPPRIPATFVDGLANTILIAEAAEAVPWAKPADLAFTANGPLPKLGTPSAGYFNAAMGDGSVWRFRKEIDEPTLRALITPNGGEITPPVPALSDAPAGGRFR
jgi:hypothetical protein